MKKKVIIISAICLSIISNHYLVFANIETLPSLNRKFSNKDVSDYNINENKLNYFGDDKSLETIIMDIAYEIKNMKSIGSTDEEMSIYLNTRLNELRYDLDGYITGHLNSQEKRLYDSNTVKGLLCMADGVLATNYAKSNYSSNGLHNDNGDAFRHTVWNYFMVIDVGYSFAKQWSDAHEYGSSGQPKIEQEMDLYNNSVGLSLGQNNPGALAHSTFINQSKEKVRNGYCKIIIGNALRWSDPYGEK